jgi:vacuolar-type H+-ATPase subunit F/Vma7
VGRLVVLGEAVKVDGYALAGATTIAVGDPKSINRSWSELPPDSSLVVLTPAAASALGSRVLERDGVLTVTMPS